MQVQEKVADEDRFDASAHRLVKRGKISSKETSAYPLVAMEAKLPKE